MIRLTIDKYLEKSGITRYDLQSERMSNFKRKSRRRVGFFYLEAHLYAANFAKIS
jgi:hypothetical protein